MTVFILALRGTDGSGAGESVTGSVGALRFVVKGVAIVCGVDSIGVGWLGAAVWFPVGLDELG